METFSALLAFCAVNSPVPCEFPAQRPVMRSFDIFFDLRPNKHLSKQSWGWWFETLSCSLWRHCNDIVASGTMLQEFVTKPAWISPQPNISFLADLIWNIQRISKVYQKIAILECEINLMDTWITIKLSKLIPKILYCHHYDNLTNYRNDIQVIEFSPVAHRAMVLHNLFLYSFQFCWITFQTIIHAFYIRSLRQSTSSAIGIEYSCRGYRSLLINTSLVASISLPSITLHLILCTLRKTFLNLSPSLQTIVAKI